MPNQTMATVVLDQAPPSRIVQVSSTTNPKALAGSIAAEFRQAHDEKKPYPTISIHAMGHGAAGQAIKAVPIVNGLLAPKGIILTVLPSFEDKEMEDESNPAVKATRTVLRMRLMVWEVGT